jgi:hypothetical protein
MGTNIGHQEQLVMNDAMPSLDSGGMETMLEVGRMFCHLTHLHESNTAPNVVLYFLCFCYYIFSMWFDGLQEVCNHLLLLLLLTSSLNPNSDKNLIKVK